VFCSEFPFRFEVNKQEIHKIVTNIVARWLHSYTALLIVIIATLSISADIMIKLFTVGLEGFKG
jgi:hypothetical protein